MNNKFIVFICGLSLLGYSTCLGQESINAAGGEAEGSGGTASFTIGETVFTNPSGDGAVSSQGVQQTYEILIGINELSSVELLLNLFPNPASSTVTLSIDEPDVTDFGYRIHDLNGKLLLENRVQSDLTLIPIEDYADATYLLEVIQLTKTVKSFTIVKNR